VITTVLINGEPSDGTIPVTDSSVLRGDGCFEVLKSYRGQPFELDRHLDRLEQSSNSLGIPLPGRDLLASWVISTSEELGDGAVRVVVTRGPSIPGLTGPPNVIVFGHPWALTGELGRLYPVRAPWHAAGADWALAGAKVLSYAPNLAATRTARAAGFGDALLITEDGVILEGPTFAVAWVTGDVLETPGLDLGILDSITRRVVLDLARDLSIEVVEAKFDLSRLAGASEVMAMSTIREVQAVVAVGDETWEPGPVAKRLADSFAAMTG
jgi:branched-subunit amino acid aminotransferase/4-amino-4-deoxychorismate lyase